MKNISKKRHLLKTITWRMIASFDTCVLMFVVPSLLIYILKKFHPTSTKIIQLEELATKEHRAVIATVIMSCEVVTKMILYYFHERIWYKINFGVKHKREDINNE